MLNNINGAFGHITAVYTDCTIPRKEFMEAGQHVLGSLLLGENENCENYKASLEQKLFPFF